MPVLCLVDTPAAHAGIGAEERGQAWAIADALLCMLGLRTPTVSVVLSEGGSGGALALALADRVLALENAVYTVTPPEDVRRHPLPRRRAARSRGSGACRPGARHRAPDPGLRVDEPILRTASRCACTRAAGDRRNPRGGDPAISTSSARSRSTTWSRARRRRWGRRRLVRPGGEQAVSLRIHAHARAIGVHDLCPIGVIE